MRGFTVQGFKAIYIDCIITWCLEQYGHFDDVILNWHQAYSIGGATHTPNLNDCLHANACLCKTAKINRKIMQTA